MSIVKYILKALGRFLNPKNRPAIQHPHTYPGREKSPYYLPEENDYIDKPKKIEPESQTEQSQIEEDATKADANKEQNNKKNDSS